MRIIAADKDYYDCIQAHGQDRSLMYFRKPEKVHFKHGQWPFPTIDEGWFDRLELVLHVIGFCGKIYPMLELYGYTRQHERFSLKCFNVEEVDAFVYKHATRGQMDSYYGNNRWGRRRGRRLKFVQFFAESEKQQDSFKEMFLKQHCPVFVATQSRSDGQITYNATLRQYDFIRIFDPYTAFQEISMFMGSMAMPEKVMPVIPDKLKIHSKGFTDQNFRAPFRDAKRVPK